MLTDSGLNFEKFRELYGFNFQDIRHEEFFEDYLEYFKYCGAVFEEDSEKMWVRPETRVMAHIQSFAMSVLRPTSAARNI